MADTGRVLAQSVRAHVRYAQLLGESEYWTLLNLKSTSEITRFLQGTKGYETALAKFTPAHTHRNDFENAMHTAVIEETGIFINSLERGTHRNFLACMLGRFEAAQIKTAFRFLNSASPSKYVLRNLPGSDFNSSALNGCNSYSAVLEAIKDTKYYLPLAELAEKAAHGAEVSLFELETALDRFSEAELFNALQLLENDERELLAPLFGVRVDLVNLYTLHRCKCYYNMNTEEIMRMLIPAAYMVQPQEIKAMADCPEDERQAYFKNKFPAYFKLFEDIPAMPDRELRLETAIRRSSCTEALKLFKKAPPGFHTTVSYLILKLHETGDLTRILEYVRYGCNPRTAAKYLARSFDFGGVS